jgi:hypothetical protein
MEEEKAESRARLEEEKAESRARYEKLEKKMEEEKAESQARLEEWEEEKAESRARLKRMECENADLKESVSKLTESTSHMNAQIASLKKPARGHAYIRMRVLLESKFKLLRKNMQQMPNEKRAAYRDRLKAANPDDQLLDWCFLQYDKISKKHAHWATHEEVCDALDLIEAADREKYTRLFREFGHLLGRG